MKGDFIMKTINEKLLNWVISKIEKDYKDDVCLLIGNSLLKLYEDMDDAAFDFFIPADEKGYNLSKTFIIDGKGYDLYPRSWECIERMANLEDYNPTLLGNARILYYRNEEDKNRFLVMQKKLNENLQNTKFMYQKALEKINVAMEIYKTMMFEESTAKVRMAAGYIADYLSVAVAFINKTYFKYSQSNQIYELSAMKELPHNFIESYKAIIHAESIDELKKLSHIMVASTRKFVNSRKYESEESVCKTDFHNLADWYQELCYTWRRIYYWCDKGNAEKVFVWGCYLQHELEIVKEEFGLKEMDLFSQYNAENLYSLRKRAEELENCIVSEIKKNGVKLDEYSSIDDFIAKNS